MPYFEQIAANPARPFELRAQEYERKIEGLAKKLAESERDHGKYLSGLREADTLITTLVQFKDSGEAAEIWLPRTLGKMGAVRNVIRKLIQDLETRRS